MKSSLKQSLTANFKILTWNVWFDTFTQAKRYEEILRITQSYSPDIICFQEVTDSFIESLKKWNGLYNYQVSDKDLDGSTIQPYGVLTLIKKDYRNVEFTFHRFPTNMARRLLVTSFDAPSSEPLDASEATLEPKSDITPKEPRENGVIKRIAVGNVHLESLDSRPYREQQLAISSQVLSSYAYAVLCGDFNFCSYRNYEDLRSLKTDPNTLENHSLARFLPNFTDTWPRLFPNIKGYTFHGGENDLVSNKVEIMRYDRICYYSNPAINSALAEVSSSTDTTDHELSEPMIPLEMILLGDQPITASSSLDTSPTALVAGVFSSPQSKSQARPLKELYGRALINVFPSDHYGLIANYHINYDVLNKIDESNL